MPRDLKAHAPDHDPWLTEREAAEELRVSISVIRAERRDGRLGFARIRGRVFYPLSLIKEYKASITCPAKSKLWATPTTDATTSSAPRSGALSVFQRARQTVKRQKDLGRLSS
ncbi:helix-turn-helix domain-containing protein [Reyranella sp.]|uniref:helix-turn-helix domain-containing protein n=1 Tax=Reyranella sp. TaxID=1929291 RepID=UPI00403604DA